MVAGHNSVIDREGLVQWLRETGRGLGFSQIGIAGVKLDDAEPGLLAWLHNGFHGSMDYMRRHGLKRARPAELVPNTASVITARLDYLPRATADGWQAVEWRRIAEPQRATVSVYARGRDYHKVLRARLARLADALADRVGPFGHRVFSDSAPVLEVELAARSGIGWRGKHTLALSRDAGSMFFLGEIFVDLELPPTPASAAHCGRCRACIDVCPTGAIVAPYRLDARRCISYLTIEHDGPIPTELRPAIGNRIVGCDDCQLVCPWNKYARRSSLPDFDAREAFGERASLLALWAWDDARFRRETEGSAIRRIGFERWQRNLAVALGNALRTPAAGGGDARPARRDGAGEVGGDALRRALLERRDGASPMVRDHIDWALAQQPC